MNCVLNREKCYTECSEWENCTDDEKKDEVRSHWLPTAILVSIATVFIAWAIYEIVS
jgi:hypothetical protein